MANFSPFRTVCQQTKQTTLYLHFQCIFPCSVRKSPCIIINVALTFFSGTNGVCSCTWDDTNSHGSICNQSRDMPNHDFNRLSNTDSGIASLQSHRSSSYSKRSSQQSSASSQWNVLNSSKQNSHSEMVKSESMVQNVRSESRTTMKNSVHSFTQKMNSSSSTTVTNVTTNARDGVDEVDFVDENVPPAIPLKTRRKQDRQPSPYDNVPEGNIGKCDDYKVNPLY